ncbi:MAG: hypothetical protein GY856_01755 [bacterium]|nr:hypothetical protein [bacterium]
MDTSAPKMEARGSTVYAPRVAPVRQRPPSVGAKDPFRLGFRERLTTTPDGREVFEQIPLTPEDLIYPQEGDVVSQGIPHYSFLDAWASPIRCYLEKRPAIAAVTSDVTIVLRHDRKNCGPDIAVVEGDFDVDTLEGGINLRAVGGRLVFALEAVSTTAQEIEDKDVKTNLKRYADEGVEEYFTVYPKPGRKVSDLVGRRLGPAGKYVEIAPDDRGRVVSKKLGLLFSIDAATEKLVVEDAGTGQRLRILAEEEEARVLAERRLADEEAARQKAEAEMQKAEAEMQKAEAEKQKETAARQKAEADLEQESQARLQALAEVERLKAQLRRIREGGAG